MIILAKISVSTALRLFPSSIFGLTNGGLNRSELYYPTLIFLGCREKYLKIHGKRKWRWGQDELASIRNRVGEDDELRTKRWRRNMNYYDFLRYLRFIKYPCVTYERKWTRCYLVNSNLHDELNRALYEILLLNERILNRTLSENLHHLGHKYLHFFILSNLTASMDQITWSSFVLSRNIAILIGNDNFFF